MYIYILFGHNNWNQSKLLAMKKLFLWMLLSFSLLSSPLKAQEVVLGYLISDSVPKYFPAWTENEFVNNLVYNHLKPCLRIVELDEIEEIVYGGKYRVLLDTICTENFPLDTIDIYVCNNFDNYCYTLGEQSDALKYLKNIKTINIKFSSDVISSDDIDFKNILKTLKLPKSVENIHHTQYNDRIPSFIELETSYLFDLPNLKNVSYKYMSSRYTILTFSGSYKLKALPEGIRKLEFIDANINSLYNLPSTLDTLIIKDNYTMFGYTNDDGEDSFIGIHALDSLPTLPSNLKYLDISGNQISYIPQLPANLVHLDISRNQISSIPVFPNTLSYIDISNNNLSNIPPLGNNIKYLAIGNTMTQTVAVWSGTKPTFYTIENSFPINQISQLPPQLMYFQMDSLNATELPFNLPSAIQTLKINGNPIPVLPALPSDLSVLELDYNRVITQLSPLPSKLKILSSRGNPIPQFPALPSELTQFYLDFNNAINQLPVLPEKLQILSSKGNQIPELHILPPFLKFLNIGENKAITSIQRLPRFLETLNVQNCTNLTCLPFLPRTLKTLVNSTSVGCLPNYTDYIKSGNRCTNLTKICNSDQYGRIGGRVYLDIDGNGIYTTNDRLLDNIIITNDFDSTRIYTASLNGSYQMLLDTAFNNVMKIPNNFIPYTTIVPSSYAINPDKAGFLSDTFNFRFAPKPNIKDLEVQLEEGGFARPGFKNEVYIFYRNTGSVFISSTQVKVKLLMPTDFNITSCEPMYSSTSGDTLIWDNIGIPQLSQEFEKIRLTVEVPASVPLTTPYTYQAFITPLAGDSTPQNNLSTLSNIVVGSYDPNDKLVTPEALLPDYPTDTKLTYTIRFQNTGTFLAENVYITDTLTKDIDPASIEVIAASHDYQFFVSGNGILEFKFDNIMLPDSNSNEPASHGFIKFSARPKSGISTGQKIVNKAEIYFDYNEPIITDFAETVIRTTTTVQLSSDIKAVVYPNPANYSLSVRLDQKDLDVKVSIFNLQGAKFFSGAMSDGLIQIDTHDLQSGIYLVVLESEAFSTTLKVMVNH